MKRIVILFFIILVSFSFTRERELVNISVISNPQNTDMSFRQVRSILKGERQRWKNGKKVKVCLMKTSTDVGYSSAKKIYRMSPKQLNRYWLGLVFQGSADSPHFFSTEEKLINFVKNNEGAIGIISSNKKNSFKVKVDGRYSL